MLPTWPLGHHPRGVPEVPRYSLVRVEDRLSTWPLLARVGMGLHFCVCVWYLGKSGYCLKVFHLARLLLNWFFD